MSVAELSFMRELMIALGARTDMKIWRQNTGQVQVYNRGQCAGVFNAGPPPGAADISGIVKPEGWRLEIETKGEKTETREAQEQWDRMISDHGGVYLRVRYDSDITMKENVRRSVNSVILAIIRRRERP